jgi:hypothetical protein
VIHLNLLIYPAEEARRHGYELFPEDLTDEAITPKKAILGRHM